MSQVLARRDDNWTKLQQYILNEDETFQVTGPDRSPIYGFVREYAWFPRDGLFIRSPLKADGVAVSDADRRKAEDEWARHEQHREERRAARGASSGTTPAALEPRFVSSAYFMRFKFDPGHYALAGREQLLGRDVLRIEYYPSKLFSEGRTRPSDKVRDRDDRVDAQMNKVALVTLWIEPAEHQILQYEFRNIDFDFLPGRALVRVDRAEASMRMGQPFPNVWLPDTITMRVGMTLATGDVNATYDVRYRDYRLATVSTKIR